MKFTDVTGKIISRQPPCVQNLVMSLSALQDFWQDLQKLNFKTLILRNINQDPLENFFGLVRQNCGCNDNPSCLHFEAAYKALLVARHSAPHSSGANCERDNGKMLLNLKTFFSSEEMAVGEEVSDENHNNISENSTTDYLSPDSPPVLHLEVDNSNDEVIDSLVQKMDEERVFSDELPARILQALKLCCSDCIKSLTNISTDVNESGVDHSYKASHNLKRIIVTARELLKRELMPKIHLSGVKYVILGEFRITCSVHRPIITDTIFHLLVRILLMEHCKYINKSVALAKRSTKNARKVAQQAGVKVKK